MGRRPLAVGLSRWPQEIAGLTQGCGEGPVTVHIQMRSAQIGSGVVLLKPAVMFSRRLSPDEMKTFAGQQIEPLFQFSWLMVFLTLLLCGGLGLLLAFTVDANLGAAVSLSFLALVYIFFGESRPLCFSQTRKVSARRFTWEVICVCLLTPVFFTVRLES